jgi:ABC-2 type transport system ATP-binding protein
MPGRDGSRGTDRPAVEVRQVQVHAGPNRQALHDLTFSVAPGEVYCVLGGSGAGKSTLLRVLLGLVPYSGQVLITEHEVSADPIRARQEAALVTSQGTLSGAMTARQNLELFVRLAAPAAPWRAEDGLNALRIMGLPERAFDRRVRELPRALMTSLWLAIAWLRQSPVLLLDEPTAGLDPTASSRIQQCVDRFRARGQAIVLATTDVLLASQLADRLAVLKQGRMVAERARADVLSLSLTELYLDYVGRPPRRASLEHPTAPRRLGI